MADVRIVAEDDGPLADAASRRLVAAGTQSIAPLETGLYYFATEAKGRRRIVKTLAAIRDPEAAPLLRHLARRDPDPDVREAAETALRALTPPR